MNLKHIKSIGIEVETFLTSKNGHIIYNASKVLEKKLGFSINPSQSRNFIQLHDLKLVTDGTVLECSAEFLNHYTNFLSWLQFNVFSKLDRIQYDYFKNKYLFDYGCYKEHGNDNFFDSPNDVYASSKVNYNAYTNTNFHSDKKDINETVTKRTAGLHFHFEFKNNYLYNTVILNAITQNLDKFKNQYLIDNSCELNNKRKLLYPDGIYRIKNHLDKGIKTYEYRSLIPSLITNDSGRNKLESFVEKVDEELGKFSHDNGY